MPYTLIAVCVWRCYEEKVWKEVAESGGSSGECKKLEQLARFANQSGEQS